MGKNAWNQVTNAVRGAANPLSVLTGDPVVGGILAAAGVPAAKPPPAMGYTPAKPPPAAGSIAKTAVTAGVSPTAAWAQTPEGKKAIAKMMADTNRELDNTKKNISKTKDTANKDYAKAKDTAKQDTLAEKARATNGMSSSPNGQSGLEGVLGGILNPLGGGPLGGGGIVDWKKFLDPLGIVTKKEKVSTAGAQPDSGSDKYAYNSALGQDGKLGANYTYAADSVDNPETVKWGEELSAPTAVKAGTVAAPEAVAARDVVGGQLVLDSYKPDETALQAIKDRALGTGESPWLKMATEKQRLEEANQRDQATSGAMGAAAAARSGLAMKGGLSGGAGERLARTNMMGLNSAKQGIGREGAMARLGLGIQDDQTKNAMLMAVPGMELANKDFLSGLDRFNVGTKLQADTTSAGNKLSADTFNAGKGLEADIFNKGLDFDAQKYNSGMDWTAALANRQGNVDIDKYNSLGGYNADVFNSTALNNANMFNTTNTLGANTAENDYRMGKLTQDMSAWGAAKQADAMANQGKK